MFFFGVEGVGSVILPLCQHLPFMMEVDDFRSFTSVCIYSLCLISASGGRIAGTIAHCLRPPRRYLQDSFGLWS